MNKNKTFKKKKQTMSIKNKRIQVNIWVRRTEDEKNMWIGIKEYNYMNKNERIQKCI